MSADRAADVTLAVHELAANAVLHGGGTGDLRIQVTGGQLICQVTDSGPAGPRSDGRPRRGAQPPDCTQPGAGPWSVQPGHGLWLIRQLASHLSVDASPAGAHVTVTFVLDTDGT